MIAVGGANEAALPLDPQAMFGHDTCDALVVDGVVAPTQYVGDASVPVARQLVLDATDQLDHVLVCQAERRRPLYFAGSAGKNVTGAGPLL